MEKMGVQVIKKNKQRVYFDGINYYMVVNGMNLVVNEKPIKKRN